MLSFWRGIHKWKHKGLCGWHDFLDYRYIYTTFIIMNRIYLVFAAATLFASCSNTQREEKLKLEAKQTVIDSINRDAEIKALAAEKARVDTVIVPVVVEKQVIKPLVKQTSPKVATEPAAQTTEKKKGWSNTAKGAVIGGVVGAGTGIAVSKDKVKGGVIGAAVGAGAGAGIGAIIDGKQKKQQQ